jgi:hypothetical protein
MDLRRQGGELIVDDRDPVLPDGGPMSPEPVST